MCGKEYESLGIARHETIHFEDRQRSSTGKIMSHVHDGDCPRCGFPETVMVRDAATGELLREYCSKRTCWWSRRVKTNSEKNGIKHREI